MGQIMYDVRAVFERIPQITGMELFRKGDQWQGRYYLNGEIHPWRRDKLKFYKFNGGVWVTEEGGETISITTWLQNYGGASDYWDAIHILKGVKAPLIMEHEMAKKVEVIRYVDEGIYTAAKQWDLKKCNLFNWMCTLFPEDKVRKAWDMYGVTTDSKGLAVFWFRDADGRLCHDKRVKYLSNGHRDKSFGGTREFITANGYSGRCFFGAHLLGEGEAVFVVESEKSAILSYLYSGVWTIATGGKNNLREKDARFRLLPDIDAIDEWTATGNEVVEWWDSWDVTDDHADVGDMIESKIRKHE